MDKAIEAAARIIDPLAFQEAGSCPPRGYECHTPEQLSRVIAARRRRALSVAKRMIAAYQAASGEARDAARYLQALTAIRRIPLMPFPDPNGHSWESFGRRVHAAWCEIQRVASQAIDAAISAREGESDE